MFWQIALQIVLIMFNAIFACAEIAVISINDTKLDRMAEDGDKRAKRLKKLTSEPSRFLATIQVAITLSGFIGSAFAADNFSKPLAKAIIGTGIPISKGVIETISLILITLILSYFTLILGELVPKRIAMKQSEKLGLAMSGLISGISRLFKPIVSLLNASTNGVLRLIGINPNSEDESVSEEEIMMMTDAGTEKGTIDKDENTMIRNVFAFDDLKIEEICTHRIDVELLWLEDPIEDWFEIIFKGRHSFYPICNDSVDNVIGVLNARAFFLLEDKSRDSILKSAVRAPFFAHENMKADKLFKRMKDDRDNQFAVVLDEYGGMNGVITITDLVEQLVGEFSKEDE